MFFSKYSKKEKTGFIILAALLVILLAVCLVSAVRFIKEESFKKNNEKDYIVLSSIDENEDGKKYYEAIYNVEGKSFSVPYRYGNKNDYIGETFALYYQKDNPENYLVDTGRNTALKLFLASLALSAIVLNVLLLIYIPVRQKYYLTENGKWKLCRVKKLEKLSFGRYCLHLDASDIARMKGKDFLTKGIKNEKLPKKIKEQSFSVYYNEKRPCSYYIDTDKLN